MHPNEHCNCRYADVGCDKMEQVMDQISGKWKMRILFMVGAHGTLRYGELRKLLDGVTHKMLSNQLKELAADGLVERIDYNEVPPRVEYRLTPQRRSSDADFLTIFRPTSARARAIPAVPRRHTTPVVNNMGERVDWKRSATQTFPSSGPADD